MKDLLLLHGALGAGDQLSNLAKQLETDFNLHLFDFPGHGGKELPAEFSIPFFASEVSKFLHTTGSKKIAIFGYSMGGYVAMYLAQNYSAQVGSVITLGTKFYWDTQVAAGECKKMQPDVIEQKVPAFAHSLQHRHGPSRWKQVLSQTSSMLMNLGTKNVINLGDYQLINIPALIMLGDRDKMVTIEESLDVYKQLPNAKFAIVPGTPHAIEQTDSELIAFHIRHFLQA